MGLVRGIFLASLLGCPSAPPSPPPPVAVLVEPQPTPPASAAPASVPWIGAHLDVARANGLSVDAERSLEHPGWGNVDEHGATWRVVRAHDREQQLVLLDRRGTDSNRIVEAVLDFRADLPADRIAWRDCALDGSLDGRVVALLHHTTGIGTCAPNTYTRVQKAWLANPESRRFVTIAVDGVRCRLERCPQPPAPPKMMIKEGMPPAEAEAVLAAFAPRFRRCYDQRPTDQADLGATIVLRLVVSMTGYVASAVAKSDLPTNNVTTCITRAAYDLTFPLPEQTLDIVYPLRFAPP